MKKTVILPLLISIVFIQCATLNQQGNLHTDRSGGFSLVKPDGWQAMDVSQKYMALVGPEENGFSPNIILVDEAYSGSISFYMDSAINLISELFTNFRLLDRSAFTTNAGVTGEFIYYTATMGNVSVRQRMFVFPNRRGNMIMAISCTAPVINGERFEEIFDEAIKTFIWTR